MRLRAPLGARSFAFAVVCGCLFIAQAEGELKSIPAPVANPVALIEGVVLLHQFGDDRAHEITPSVAVGVRAWDKSWQVVRVTDLALMIATETTELVPFKPEPPYFGILRDKTR